MQILGFEQRKAGLCAVALAALTVVAAQEASADSWNTKTNVSASWLYNDNPTLRPKDSPLKRQATSYGRIQARGTAEYSTPVLFVDISPRISQTYYPKPEDSDLQTTNFYIESNVDYNLRRNNLDLLLDYSNVGLLTDEFGDGIDDDASGAGAGSTLRVDDRVQRYTINPEWTYQLTRRDSLTLSMAYAGTDYKLEKTNRADNQNAQVQLSYNRAITERLRLGITGSGRNFESEKLAPIPVLNIKLTNSSDSYGLSLDTSYSFTENTSMGLNVGRTEISSTREAFFLLAPTLPVVQTTTSKSSNTVYNFTLNHTGERNSFNLLLSQGIVPSSLGFENTQISLNLLARRRLSEKLTGVIRINGYNQKAVDQQQRGAANSSYRFFSGSTSLAWRLTPSWVTSAVYTYRQNSSEFGNASQRGQSNTFGITLTYLWD